MFLDIMMPEMNGYDLLEILRTKEPTRAAPVIMLTSKNNPEDVIDGYSKGVDYYIPKPTSKDQLMYALELVLGEDESA